MRSGSERPGATALDGIGSSHRFLRPQDLAELAGLRICSRFDVSTLQAGPHRSALFGQSLEFLEHREYQPGDALDHVDWKVYARSDRLFVKRFENQTELDVTVVVDASASMEYPVGIRDDKFVQACRIAAALAFLTLQQNDRIGLAMTHAGSLDHFPAGRATGQLERILDMLTRASPAGRAQLARALAQLAERNRRGGVLVLISDLYDELDPVMDALARCSVASTDVLCLQLLHPDEIELPAEAAEAVFHDAESRDSVRVNVDDIRDDYRVRMAHHRRACAEAFAARGMGFYSASTAESCGATVRALLQSRARSR